MALTLYDIESAMPVDVTLALAIAGESLTHRAGQRHTGFVVNGDGQKCLFHLAWHKMFLREVAGAEYAYAIVPRLDEISSAAIIGFLFGLHDDTKGLISYSVNYEEKDYFDDNNNLVLTGPGQGFTCATFVIEVLRKHELNIVSRDTWPINNRSIGWQWGMVHALPLASEDFIAQCAAIGKVARFAPEQAVGAACYFLDAPIEYDEAERASAEVVSELTQLAKDWPAAVVSQWVCPWGPKKEPTECGVTS